jgi:hypothetical protein
MGIEVKHSHDIISSEDTATNDAPTSVALSASSFSSASSSPSSQINHADDQTFKPVSQHGDSYVLTYGSLTEKETKILSNQILKAFDQIAEKNCTLPLLR